MYFMSGWRVTPKVSDYLFWFLKMCQWIKVTHACQMASVFLYVWGKNRSQFNLPAFIRRRFFFCLCLWLCRFESLDQEMNSLMGRILDVNLIVQQLLDGDHPSSTEVRGCQDHLNSR